MQEISELSRERIEEALGAGTLWRKVVYLPTTGSTNDVAKGLAAQGAPEGTVVVADEQTAGRGRMRRRWLSPPGTCLLCSILFRPTLPPTQAQRLTMLCALAAADAVEKVAGLGVALKWPNDLIVKSPIPNPQSQNWRKLAGVLTETGMMGERLEFVVVGIGINVNVEPETLPSLTRSKIALRGLPNPRLGPGWFGYAHHRSGDPGRAESETPSLILDATSILAETGRRVDRVALLAALLAGVEQRYEALRAGESPHQEWAARLATLGRTVQATTVEGVLAGVAESVDGDGALLLRTPDGTLHRLLAGDVTLTGPSTFSATPVG
jgi:BirA family biotin operon repressor/biotin-[acetyl-CoA-carboxylase] ligase